MTDTLNSPSRPPTTTADQSGRTGAVTPSVNNEPVGADDRAVIAVFPDIDVAQGAVEKLAAAGFPIDRVSIVGRDLQSELRVNGFVTTGDIAGPSAATGAWVGGLFGLLAGSALLFIPGAGPLIVLGPLAAAAIGAAEGALVAGGIGAILGHFVEKQHIPKYEELVRAGNYLVIVHGTEEDVARGKELLTASGSSDVQRHDTYRRSALGPIERVREGMPVVDANGTEIGTVEFVKMSDPEAVTTQGEEPGNGEPHVPGELRERLVRVGFLKVDRKGLLRPDVYVAADEIEGIEGGTVRLRVDGKNLPKEAD